MFALCEALEFRRLLTVTFDQGYLKVRGGEGDDVIFVEFNEELTRVVVRDNTSIRRFNVSDVFSITLLGRGGNDTLSLASNVCRAGNRVGAGPDR